SKLREKLGLAPLLLDDQPKAEDKTSELENVYTKDGVKFVHKPAANWGDAKKEEKLREKLEALKEKRKVQEKLSSVKTLSTLDDNDDGSAASWVNKSRKLDEEKRLAEQRAKALEEMDKEFSIGDLLPEVEKDKKYTAKNLKGLTVQHSLDTLVEGSEMILVLQDKDVLDNDSEEVLINPTLSLHERWSKNAELRKKKPGYNAYEDEFDDLGNIREKTLLGKYDEEIDGEKKTSFKIGSKGLVDPESFKEAVAQKLRLAQFRDGCTSLEPAPTRLATEFFTKEEMATKFKKVKKKVQRVRKRRGCIADDEEETNAFRADDLMKHAEPEKIDDFGSRKRGKGKLKQKYETEEKIPDEPKEKRKAVDLSKLKVELDDPEISETEDYEELSGVVVEDEAENELQSVLQRTRILKQFQEPKIKEEPHDEAQLIMRNIKSEPVDDESMEIDQQPQNAAKSNIILNDVSEYCRGLGDIPTYGLAGNRDDIDPSDMYYQENSKIVPDYGNNQEDSDIEDEIDEERGIDSISSDEGDKERGKSGRWVKAKFGESSKKRKDSESSDEGMSSRPPILEDEPVAAKGVMAALALAKKKGYLEAQESDEHGPSRLAHLEAKRFTVIDKQFHDIDDKYAKKLERMGGHTGPVSEFKEKKDYAPRIKLEYADKKGNLMDTKEAFRYMSWKFHGKQPGKKKTQMRLNKFSKTHLMNQMSSTDTPLCTLSKQIDKQKQLSTPYIVLSGAGSKDIVGSSIRKE
uniref:U4/U6.U5 tri-snRNP-associated protein 1 n=1 Tax=Romanomermis culicivorax TaxID=13658 RepID=A0A915I290_ROMCU